MQSSFLASLYISCSHNVIATIRQKWNQTPQQQKTSHHTANIYIKSNSITLFEVKARISYSLSSTWCVLDELPWRHFTAPEAAWGIRQKSNDSINVVSNQANLLSEEHATKKIYKKITLHNNQMSDKPLIVLSNDQNLIATTKVNKCCR